MCPRLEPVQAGAPDADMGKTCEHSQELLLCMAHDSEKLLLQVGSSSASARPMRQS
jgi:hypothetical protein